MESEVEVSEYAGIVVVKPVYIEGWLKENHDGAIRYSNTFERITPQNVRDANYLNTGITPEEEKEFERDLNLPAGTLSNYNADYWGSFFIDIGAEGIVLNMAKPLDRLKCKVLKAHTEIANSILELQETAGARYVITSKNQEAVVKNKRNKEKRDAVKAYNKMSINDMKDLLAYFDKPVSNASTPDFIESALFTILEENTRDFINAIQDPDLKMKIFVKKCMLNNLLKNVRGKIYVVGLNPEDNEYIGGSFINAVDYMGAKENQDVYRKLLGDLEAKK